MRRNHCNSSGYIPPRFLHSPCFKYIVYQINSFALIVAQFPSTFVILLLFYHPEISNFRPCSPSFEDAILDSELENVGPTLSNYTMRRTRCAHGDTAALKGMHVYILNGFCIVCFRGHFSHFLTYSNQYSWYLSAYTSINFVHDYLMEFFCFIFFHNASVAYTFHLLGEKYIRNPGKDSHDKWQDSQ